MRSDAEVLVAHGGGVPEALTVILPILIFGGFLYVERRKRRGDAEPAPRPEDESGATGRGAGTRR